MNSQTLMAILEKLSHEEIEELRGAMRELDAHILARFEEMGDREAAERWRRRIARRAALSTEDILDPR